MRLSAIVFWALISASFLVAAHDLSAQTSTNSSSGGIDNSSATPEASPTPVVEPWLKRWFGLDTFVLSTRYKFVRTENGHTTANVQQYQVIARAKFKFDANGRYSINAGLSTGNSLTVGWNNTGVGTGDLQTNLYLKQMFFDAKPTKGLEVQVGGLGVNRGENTEITSYDNDVYIMGERVSIRLPKHLYFDEVSATNAFIGDSSHPSVFQRFHRLGKANYHQFLVRKQASKQVSFSADYTFDSGGDTFHEALRIKVPKSHLFDLFLFENYQRVSPDRGYGFGAYAEKALNMRFTLNGGFTRIDRPMLNGDPFPPGKRLYFGGTYKLSRELSVNSILIRGVGHMPTPQTPRTRFDLILTYNVLETLHRHRIF